MHQLKNLVFDSKHYQTILAILNSQKISRIVGGSIRDNLIGKPTNDIDIATALLPADTTALLTSHKIKVIPTGLKFGGVTAIIGDEKFEITTLRKDILTDGRKALVQFTDDFEADAVRRDFTMNALSYDTNRGEIYDYCNGLEDLKAQAVKFIGDPFVRINQDYLRILRFFRFSAHYSNQIDQLGLEAATELKDNLTSLSRERIKWEMDRLIMAEDPTLILSITLQHKILNIIFPEITEVDIANLNRGLKIAKNLKLPLKLTTRYALLFSSKEINYEILNQYKFSKSQSKVIIHNETTRNTYNSRSPQFNLNNLWFNHLDYEQNLLYLSAMGLISEIEINNFLAKINSQKPPVFPISGKDLQNFSSGSKMGSLLQFLKDHWIDLEFTLTKEDLLLIAKQHQD